MLCAELTHDCSQPRLLIANSLTAERFDSLSGMVLDEQNSRLYLASRRLLYRVDLSSQNRARAMVPLFALSDPSQLLFTSSPLHSHSDALASHSTQSASSSVSSAVDAHQPYLSWSNVTTTDRAEDCSFLTTCSECTSNVFCVWCTTRKFPAGFCATTASCRVQIGSGQGGWSSECAASGSGWSAGWLLVIPLLLLVVWRVQVAREEHED